MKKEQMELGLDKSLAFRRTARKQRRSTRAQWWFSQMRQLVDHAPELAEPTATIAGNANHPLELN